MKQIFTTAILILLCPAFAGAQDWNSIYNRYSGEKGVSSVYISPSMFNLMNSLPEVEVEAGEVDFGKIIRTFKGMYILDIDNTEIAESLSKEIINAVSKGKYELLMEAKDEGETMQVYITTKGDTVSEFLMMAHAPEILSVIAIIADMPLEALKSLIE